MTQAAVYTHGHHSSVLRSHQWRTVENSAGYLLPYLREGLSVLDVGCGPGTITADIARLVAPAPVVALDNAESVLEPAREAAAAQDLRNVEFKVGDVHRLEFDDDSFDIVHAHQVLQHVSDPVSALSEMRRVCKPGGIVAARDADYAAMTWYPSSPELDEWLELYRHIARDNGGEPDAGRRLLAWARAAGFTDISAGSTNWCFATDADRQWWSQMWSDRIRHSGIAEHAVAEGYAASADLDRLSQAWRDWGTDPDGWFNILHGEILCRA